MRTQQQKLEELRLELASYVKFRERFGPALTFAGALSGHREQVRLNMLDEPNGPWRDRLALCDELAHQEGLSA